MTPARRDTIVDLVTVAVAVWFLVSPAFADMRSPVADAVAALVLAYAVLRMIRRLWGRS